MMEAFALVEDVSGCRSLIRQFEFGSPEHMEQCIRFTGDVTEQLAQMLDEDSALA